VQALSPILSPAMETMDIIFPSVRLSKVTSRLAAGFVVLCVVLGSVYAAPLEGQRAPSDPMTSVYVQLVSSHFGLPAGEASLLLEDLGETEQLPVLLLLSRESGIPPAAVLSRRYRAGPSGISWVAVARQLNLGAAVFHVDIPEDEVDDRVRRAMDLFRGTSRANWNALDLEDAEVVALTHVRFLSRQVGVSKGEVLAARAQSGSWVEAIQHVLGVP